MIKISKFEWVGIFVYISILFVIAAVYLLGAGNNNSTPDLSESGNVNRTEGVTSNQTTSDVEVPFVIGDLKVLSITHKPKRLHKGEKGNFTLRFSWDSERKSDEFTIGLYVDGDRVDSVSGWMDAHSSDRHSLYWTAKRTGEKQISMRLDIYDEISERNESNNNATLNLVIYQ